MDHMPEAPKIGYGKPPVQHQFRKGAPSPNPKGRPKGTRNRKSSSGMEENKICDLLLAEANRQVTIKENGDEITLSTMQAVIRSVAVNAIKGKHPTQLLLTTLVQKAEQKMEVDRIFILRTAIEYKQHCIKMKEVFRDRKIEEPETMIHPDDIIIDYFTGDVYITGPYTFEQQQTLRKLLDQRARAQASVNLHAEAYQQAQAYEAKEISLLEWHFYQRLFDLFNDVVPERCKVALENRSWREGASREGEELKKFMETDGAF